MNILIKIIFIAISLTGLNSCYLAGALVMAQEKKTTVNTWGDDNYKVRIQKKRGWAGPPYFHCRVKEKKLSGLYYKTIVHETFSQEMYASCKINFPLRLDTLTVDICNKKITTTSEREKQK